MSTIVTAAILVTITIAIPLVLIFIGKKNTRKRNEEHFNLFSLAGSNHGLSFSNHELLKNKIIGLDTLNRELLIYEFENANVIRININELNNCTVNKEYDSIDMGNDKKAKLEKHLRYRSEIQFQRKC